MERDLWPLLYRTLRAVARGFAQKYVPIPGWVLVATMLWAALHDRPVSWACQAKHWSTTRFRPPTLPSPATMSRRIDRGAVGLLGRAVEQRLRTLSAAHPALAAYLDGKPLPVGGATKDREARYGRGAGTMAKGYQLHTVWSMRAMPETWEVTPLNTSEKTVAHRLIPQLTSGGYLLADGNYDASDLFDLAWPQGYQLATPLPSGDEPGSGHHYSEPAPAAKYRHDAVEVRSAVIRLADGDRAQLRECHLLWRRPGAVAGVGAWFGSGAYLGVGQAPHQRGANPEEARTYGKIEKYCSASGWF